MGKVYLLGDEPDRVAQVFAACFTNSSGLRHVPVYAGALEVSHAGMVLVESDFYAKDVARREI